MKEPIKKIVVFGMLIMTILFTGFIGIIYFDTSKVVSMGIIDKELDNNMLIYYMPEVKKDDGYLKIENAYAFIPDEEIRIFNTYVVLEDVETKESYRIPTIQKVNEKVNEEYQSEVDYSKSGFSAYVKQNKLDMLKKYEVLIWLDADCYVHTGVYIE